MSTKLAEWASDHETQYDSMMAGAELVKRTATQSLATLTAWWEEGRKTVRSQDNKVIYQIRKVKEFLIEGGWEDKERGEWREQRGGGREGGARVSCTGRWWG